MRASQMPPRAALSFSSFSVAFALGSANIKPKIFALTRDDGKNSFAKCKRGFASVALVTRATAIRARALRTCFSRRRPTGARFAAAAVDAHVCTRSRALARSSASRVAACSPLAAARRFGASAFCLFLLRRRSLSGGDSSGNVETIAVPTSKRSFAQSRLDFAFDSLFFLPSSSFLFAQRLKASLSFAIARSNRQTIGAASLNVPSNCQVFFVRLQRQRTDQSASHFACLSSAPSAPLRAIASGCEGLRSAKFSLAARRAFVPPAATFFRIFLRLFPTTSSRFTLTTNQTLNCEYSRGRG